MKFRLIAICALLLLLIPINEAHCQDYVEYKIQINSDSSATWIITQVADINASIDTWGGFQQRIIALVDAAKNETLREMDIDVNSLEMKINIAQSKTIEYRLTWQNFCITEGGKKIFGDVFRVENFFLQLYGDGVLYITYPSIYTLESVSPTPNENDASLQSLKWFSTKGFINRKPHIVLTSQNGKGWQQNAILIVGSVTAVAAFAASFYWFKGRRRGKEKVPETTLSHAPLIESDEEKILKILKASGGTLNQSTIVEQCGFSKAKTSQLLAALEQKGIVRRYKKGRDKIVILAAKGDTQ